MQHIAQILKTQPMTHFGVQKQTIQQVPVRDINQTTSSTCNATDNNKKRVENLFTRFAVFYGHLWRSQFKNDGFLEFAKNEWLEGLSRVDDDTLNQAIIDCRDYYEMPPSLPQLIGICRAITERDTIFVASKEFVPASSEVIIAAIKQCKSFLFK